MSTQAQSIIFAHRGGRAMVVHAWRPGTRQRAGSVVALCNPDELHVKQDSPALCRKPSLEVEGKVACTLCKAELARIGVPLNQESRGDAPDDATPPPCVEGGAEAGTPGKCGTCGLPTDRVNGEDVHVLPDGRKLRKGRGGCQKPKTATAGYVARPAEVDPPRKLDRMPATDTKYAGIAADKVVREPAPAPEADDRPICDTCGCLEGDGCTCTPPSAPVPVAPAETSPASTPEPAPEPVPAALPAELTPAADAGWESARDLLQRSDVVAVRRDAMDALVDELVEWRRNAVILPAARRTLVARIVKDTLRNRATHLTEAEWDVAAAAYADLLPPGEA